MLYAIIIAQFAMLSCGKSGGTKYLSAVSPDSKYRAELEYIYDRYYCDYYVYISIININTNTEIEKYYLGDMDMPDDISYIKSISWNRDTEYIVIVAEGNRKWEISQHKIAILECK